MTLALGLHDALLDPATGNGLLLFPAGNDVVIGTSSLHVADHDAAVRVLDGHGWELTRGGDGHVVNEGVTADGRECIGLYGRAPLSSDADLDDCIDAFAELLAAAGIVPAPRYVRKHEKEATPGKRCATATSPAEADATARGEGFLAD